jgi:hypothetical protein
MLGCIHSRKFGAAIVGAAIMLAGASVDCYATVGGGGQVARFQNANGVILELVGAQLGLEVSLGSAGMTIVLQ